ncbi:MAG: NAD-dependent epimerase/dehydratase family protein [Planctomycetota bacterium]|nr:NAD-dependent epimerase/dehydratase family protein [Planctomycetota bacterium]
MAHIVLTGGAGFVGSHLCDALLARGDRVTAFDNFTTGSRANVAHLAGNDAFRLVEQDVSLGIPVEGDVDAVLHFASPASPKHYLADPIATLRAGSYATHHALDLSRDRGAVFMMASTSEVYGDPEITPQPESYWGNVSSIGPRSCYDEAKRYAEAATMAYRRQHGLDTRIVRLFNTYGPRMDLDDGRALPAFLKAAEEGGAIEIHGDGLQTRAFCYVDDTVEGILTVLDKGDDHPVNVGRPGEMTILDFARLVLELTESDAEITHVAPLEHDPKRREPEIRRLEALGWAPQVDVREGLERTVAWFRARAQTAS